ncbi:MAG TPA: ankyrin repeat domain-containing protein [Marmoricola sp.]|nr:ankyrin repeat domain-containing protein [Marmoricola sp.]
MSSPVVGPLVLALVILLAGCSGTGDEPSGARSPSPSPSPSTPTTTSPTEPGRTLTGRPSPGPREQARLDAALIEAAWDNDVPRARRLVRSGADVNHQDETQQSAYLIATSEGFRDLLELTLRNGAEVNDKDSFNGTGLIRAAERGHAAVVGRLVQAGIDLDHVNNLGWTALHEAVILGDGDASALETVRTLVAAGVDVTIPAVRDGRTALQHASERGYDAIASVLERADRPMDRPGRRILAAARDGDADGVALALRHGARLEQRDSSRRTPLLLAVTGDHVEAAQVLLNLGADPDALDGQHDTPWLVTGVTGSARMAELLLEFDPDLTILNRFGGTSLIPASERGHVAYVRRVVQTPIDVDHVNELGWTALLEAVILGEGTRRWQQVVQILLDAGADPTIPDRNGVTALEHARRSGHDEIARLLARTG